MTSSSGLSQAYGVLAVGLMLTAPAGTEPGARAAGAPQHRHAYDRRHRLERFRRLWWG